MKYYFRITTLPGDGIGPEIMNQSYKVFDVIQKKFNFKIVTNECKIGGDAIDNYNTPLPDKTLDNCKNSDAILLGAVGGPKWKNLPSKQKPEIGALLKLRKIFNLFANLRPIILSKELKELSPLNTKIIPYGFNILCVRELISDIYFGAPKGRSGIGNQEYAFDTAVYRRFEIEQIAHIAFQLAQKRKKHITSIDKANVLQTSIFWREIVSQIATQYPDIKIEHLYVDNASMQLINNPSKFDVILCPNLFGDILSDECAMLSGSIGMLPSASINKKNFGLYEPAGGSAPDIAKKNIANPIAQILSIALLFRYSLKLEKIAKSIEKSVYQVLKLGYRTQDISLMSSNYKKIVGTEEMGSLIASLISL